MLEVDGEEVGQGCPESSCGCSRERELGLEQQIQEILSGRKSGEEKGCEGGKI